MANQTLPETPKDYSQAAVQNVMTHHSGVKLAIDRRTGQYRISFDKQALQDAGKEFFEAEIKPLLIKHHQLKDGPEVRFHWQPETQDWAMRYRFVSRDEQGNEILEDGKRQYDSYHFQAQAIANTTTDAIGRKLAEKLGLSKEAHLDI
jgi:hypothetical protein